MSSSRGGADFKRRGRRTFCHVCGTLVPVGEYRCKVCAIKKNKRRKIPRAIRAQVYARGVCALCGGGEIEGDPWTVDHRVPLIRGGTNHPDNLDLAHRSCNSRKGAFDGGR